MLSPVVAALALLQAQPHTPTTPRPLSPFLRAKAEALLRDHLPCLGCHELGGEGGRVGPSLSHLRGTRTVDFVRRMLEDPRREVPGTIMPRSLADPATRELIARYLVERAPTTPAGPAVARPPAATGDTTASARYRRTCAPCHGEGGRGDGPNAPFLPVPPTRHADAAYMRARPDDALYDAIAAGGAAMGRSPRMPGFGGSLTPGEIRGLVRYLRALCRCEGPAWSERP